MSQTAHKPGHGYLNILFYSFSGINVTSKIWLHCQLLRICTIKNSTHSDNYGPSNMSKILLISLSCDRNNKYTHAHKISAHGDLNFKNYKMFSINSTDFYRIYR